MSAAGLVASIAGSIGKRKAKKKLEKELANAPKYKINEEAFENQALAKNQAFGRDRSIQMQEENIAQGAVDASMSARDATNSTSALLASISAIQANKNQNLRALSQDEALLQNQKMGNLQNVNNQMIDEKDKAWNHNVNMPFQMRVGMYRDQRKAGEEMELAGVAAQAQTESAFAGSMGSMMGGIACDERIKTKIKDCNIGLETVMKMSPVSFDYTHDRFNDGRNHLGFIAQDIEKIVPQAVDNIHGTEFLKINYNELVPVLVNAIKEQQNLILQLQRDIESLQELKLQNTLIGATL